MKSEWESVNVIKSDYTDYASNSQTMKQFNRILLNFFGGF